MSSEQRAALVDQLATAIVDIEAELNDGNPAPMAERIVSWLEAAGGWPRPSVPSPDRAALAERIGKEAVARYSYIHPSAITMGADTGVDGETWGDIVRDIGNLALVAVEAAGWGPRPEAVTENEMAEIATGVGFDMLTRRSAREITARAFDALPERHRAIVLGSRGITVEGEQ